MTIKSPRWLTETAQLAEKLGDPDGSLLEWAQDPSLPMETD